MDYYSENKAALVAYFERGIDQDTPRKLGMELEHFLVDEKLRAVPYLGGVERVLNTLSLRERGERRFSDGHLIGFTCPGHVCPCAVSLEPGGQFELSIGPDVKLEDIARTYDEVIEEARSIANEFGYYIINLGYQPRTAAKDIEILPKERYRIMNAHFAETGKHGINMMRGTASTQVTLGYSSEAEAERLFRWASYVTPELAWLTDNAKQFDGASYGQGMLRARIWEDVDAARCGFVPLQEGEGFFAAYADYILNTPLLLILDEQGNGVNVDGTVAEVYRDKVMTEDEIAHALSMVFPHVRLRTYVEIRLMDSIPRDFAVALTALISGSCGLADKGYGSVVEAEKRLRALEQGNAPTEESFALLDEMLEEAEKSPWSAYLHPLAECIKTRTNLKNMNCGGAW